MSIKKIKYELLKNKSFKKYYNKHELEHSIAVMVMGERIKQGLTQWQLAKKSKLLQPALGRLEAGNHLPNLKTLQKIAKGLGMEILITLNKIK